MIGMTPDHISRSLEEHNRLLREVDKLRAELAQQGACCEAPACHEPKPCQCNQQLVDIIGNLVAVLRERSHG